MVLGSTTVATLNGREKTVAHCLTRKAFMERVHDWSSTGTLGICIIVLWTACVHCSAVACLPCHSVCLDFELLLFTFVRRLFAHCIVSWSAVAAIHQAWPPLQSSTGVAVSRKQHRTSTLSASANQKVSILTQYSLQSTHIDTHIVSTVCLVRD